MLGFNSAGPPQELKRAAERLQSVDRTRESDCDFLEAAEVDVLEAVGATQYKRIDSGTDRVVYSIPGGRVMKIARSPHLSHDGVRANRLEAIQYNSAHAEAKRWLAPVHLHARDSSWLVMEEAAQIRGYEHEIPHGFRKKLKAAGIDYGDTLRWNVGYIESRGHDCLIDYGLEIF